MDLTSYDSGKGQERDEDARDDKGLEREPKKKKPTPDNSAASAEQRCPSQ